MLFSKLKVLKSHGKQYIEDLKAVTLSDAFMGRIEIENGINPAILNDLCNICPSYAISINPLKIDIGKCVFCGECEAQSRGVIRFTNDHRIATNDRNRLIVKEGINESIELNPDFVRKEIVGFFSHALRLRAVSCGSDNSAEMELNASGNVNFDMSRYGIEFVASPRHADGIVITGVINKNMSKALEICYEAMSEPKLIILAGTDAISSGVFHSSNTLDRSFLVNHKPDLYIPGNPPHPMTFICGIMSLIKGEKF